MTVAANPMKTSYSGNGVTTVFNIPFQFFNKSELEVITRVVATAVETVCVEGGAYTVLGVDPILGIPGTDVSFAVAPPVGTQVHIRRKLPASQTIDISSGLNVPGPTYEEGYDRAAMRLQELEEKIARAPQLAKTTPTTGLSLSEPVAGEFLKFNTAGTGIDSSAALGIPVNISGLTNGDLLQYNSTTGLWTRVAAASLGVPIGSLTPVSITSPSGAQVLTFDGTNWTNLEKVPQYASDAAFVSALGAAQNGDIYYNTTSNVIRVYVNSAWSTLADTSTALTASSTNTVTNKTMSGASNTFTNIPNSATTAVSTNTNSAIVTRDGSGNFAAGTITANLTGNVTGNVTGNASGTAANVTGTVAIANGGTGQTAKTAAFDALSPMTTSGDVIYGGASGTGTRLAKGADGQVLTLQSGLPAWVTATGGSSSGINYISASGGNADFESNVTGWTTYDDAAAAPVDGTGGSPTLTFTRSTSSPLRGTASGLVTPGALGNGVAYAFTIDSADKAKVLNISLDYALSAQITDGDYVVSIYDVTNSAVIQPAPTKITGTSGTNYKFSATFQSASNSTSYRLLIHQAVSTSVTLKIDNVIVGPQAIQYGAPITDWQSFTPTGTWTGGTVAYTGMWRRVGDKMEIRSRVTASGAVTATNLAFNLPSGYTIDTAKLPSTAEDVWFGRALIRDAATASYDGMVAYNNTTSVTVLAQGISTHVGNVYGKALSVVSNTIPMTFGASDMVDIEYSVPIVGWSSSVQMSNDTDTRVVAAQATRSSSQSATTGTEVVILYDAVLADTHGNYSTSTGKYTVTVPGYYRVSATMDFGANSTNAREIRLRKGGSNIAIIGQNPNPGAAISVVTGTATRYFNAGEYMEIVGFQNSGSTLNIGALGATYNHMSIERLSGPSAIAAGETTSAKYASSAGNTIAASSVATIVDFATKDYDTHGSVTTGASWKFTANIPGQYQISTNVLFANAVFTVGTARELYLYKGGSIAGMIDYKKSQTTTTDFVRLGGSIDVRLLAGEYVDIRAVSGEGATRTLETTATNNWVSIKRVGNY